MTYGEIEKPIPTRPFAKNIPTALISKLRRWFYNKLSGEELNARPLSATNIESFDSRNCIRFKIVWGRGGKIVETNRFDSKKDEFVQGLYIITDDKDLGNELEKIFTYESLKS